MRRLVLTFQATLVQDIIHPLSPNREQSKKS